MCRRAAVIVIYGIYVFGSLGVLHAFFDYTNSRVISKSLCFHPVPIAQECDARLMR